MKAPIALGLSEQKGGTPHRLYGYVGRFRDPSLVPVIRRPHMYAQIIRVQAALWRMNVGLFAEPIDGPRDLTSHQDKSGALRFLLPGTSFPGPYPLGLWEGTYELVGSSVLVVLFKTTPLDKALEHNSKGE